MPNFNACEARQSSEAASGAPGAIAAATLALEASRVGLELSGLEGPARSQAIADFLGGRVEHLLATSPTLAEINARQAIYNPLVIRIGGRE